jgi:two-component system response regulator HydG
LIEDDTGTCEVLKAELEARSFDVVVQKSAEAALALLSEDDFGVVISELSMRAQTGEALYRRVSELRPETPIIVLTAYEGEEVAVAAVRAGVYDFVTKPVDLPHLALTIERALEHRALLGEIHKLRSAVSEWNPFYEMPGANSLVLPPMDEVEQRYVSRVLEAVGGNKASAARVLGVDRRTLYRKLDRWRDVASRRTNGNGNGASMADAPSPQVGADRRQ